MGAAMAVSLCSVRAGGGFGGIFVIFFLSVSFVIVIVIVIVIVAAGARQVRGGYLAVGADGGDAACAA
jgi:hypothetical protein